MKLSSLNLLKGKTVTIQEEIPIEIRDECGGRVSNTVTGVLDDITRDKVTIIQENNGMSQIKISNIEYIGLAKK